jgi:anti-sigma factor RsiW
MHQVVVDGLEEYLARTASAEVRQRLEAHLESCAACRTEVAEMRQIADMFAVLKAGQEIAAAPGFSARVWNTIEAQRPAPFWGVLLDPAFFRRTAFACLMILALLGSYLVSRETEYGYGSPGPETVIAIERNDPGYVDDPVQDRDMMLVTLASYTQ